MSVNLNDYIWLLEGIEKYVDEHEAEFLTHYGVKGMKWGVRKDKKPSAELTGLGPDKIVRKTKSGETLTLTKEPPMKIHKLLAKNSPKYAAKYNDMAHLSITDSAGKKVGNASVWKKGEEELYLNWIGIKESERGKGYATAILKAAEEYGKTEGVKKMTLEVPGNSPDARHIYESMGFRVTKEPGRVSKNDMWGGLTSMEYTFKEAKHSLGFEEVLEHYGVKGMKWGVRRSQAKLARDQKKLESSEIVMETALANGGKLVVAKIPPTKVEKFMSSRSETLKENFELSHSFTLHGSDGGKVGKASFYQLTPDSLDLEWIGVDKAHRRQGYARATLEGVIGYAKDRGITELTLTATKMGAPLYEDLGFVPQKNGTMVLKVPQTVEHSDKDAKELARYIIEAINRSPEINKGKEVVMSTEFEEVLEHYGVKGMRWGVRRSNKELKKAREAREVESLVKKAQKDGVSTLTNDEINKVNKRLNLEQKYNQLDDKRMSNGQKAAATIVTTAGTAKKAYDFATSPTGKKIAGMIVNHLAIDFTDMKI